MGAGEFLGTVAGDLLGGANRRRADTSREEALLELLRLNPEAGRSAMEGVNADPAAVAAQRAVLERLMREGQQTGLGLEDRVALSQAQAETARQERGSREAILQTMAARGQGGGGSELAAALTAQQGGADRASMAGAQAAADARRRQLQALQASGALAGQVRNDSFGEGAARASAADSIAKFNAGQRVQRAGMLYGARRDRAGDYDARAEETRRRGAGIGAGVGSAVGAATGQGWM